MLASLIATSRTICLFFPKAVWSLFVSQTLYSHSVIAAVISTTIKTVITSPNHAYEGGELSCTPLGGWTLPYTRNTTEGDGGGGGGVRLRSDGIVCILVCPRPSAGFYILLLLCIPSCYWLHPLVIVYTLVIGYILLLLCVPSYCWIYPIVIVYTLLLLVCCVL